jgi:hypothetical protein
MSKFLDWLFYTPPPIVALPLVPQHQVIVPPPAVMGHTPSQEERQANVWRAGHIADALEQWKEREGTEHPHRNAMVSEALSLGWTAVTTGDWTAEQVKALQERLSQ